MCKLSLYPLATYSSGRQDLILKLSTLQMNEKCMQLKPVNSTWGENVTKAQNSQIVPTENEKKIDGNIIVPFSLIAFTGCIFFIFPAVCSRCVFSWTLSKPCRCKEKTVSNVSGLQLVTWTCCMCVHVVKNRAGFNTF